MVLKSETLRKRDQIAVVSLSWTGLGDEELTHKYVINKH